MSKYIYSQFRKDYPNDDTCLNKIMALRYGDKPVCRECKQKTKYHRIKSRRAFACQFCGEHIYPCVGTPFEKSSTPLYKWFFAMYLFTATKHEVSAKELQRQLGVTYKCAWRIGREIKKLIALMKDEKLFSEVEMDETYSNDKRQGRKHEKA